METRNTLFTEVRPFYENLAAALEAAENEVSMMYFTFDDGAWARRIAAVLRNRAACGVRVRLMVDGLGLITDNPRNTLANRRLLNELQQAGVQVDIFQPYGPRLSTGNRLHTKICAIDTHTAFIGGSNIGDHYTTWQDTNLRLDGVLGSGFHTLYDFIRKHTRPGHTVPTPGIHLSRMFAGGARIWLTVPRRRRDIRRELLKIILDAETDIYIRNWYFLPDQEILDALRFQAEQGVRVHVLLSHRTRVRLIDFANRIHGHKLAKSGGRVLRYTGGYMHAKVAWNDHGEVLFGSANMDRKALADNFECSLSFVDLQLKEQLSQAFEMDAGNCLLQDEKHFKRCGGALRVLAFTCNIFSAWL